MQHVPDLRSVAVYVTRDPARLRALCDLWRATAADVWVTLQGCSMSPTYMPGTRLLLRCGAHNLEVGAVVAYRMKAALAVHRVVAIELAADGKRQVVCKGDANSYLDEPILEDEVVGVVVASRRPGVVRTMAMRARLITGRTLRIGRRFYRMVRRREGQNGTPA